MTTTSERPNRRPRAIPTAARKDAHLQINLERDVQSTASTGLGSFRFTHRALPEIDLAEVDLSATFLGRRISAPLLISCMTGGTELGGRINRTLAEVAQRLGVALGLGSSRVVLEDHRRLETFRVRHLAPDIPLLANLGAVQLRRGVRLDDARRLVAELEADALVLHLNPLQESLQLEGDVEFRGLLELIAEVCAGLERPVIVKEVGHGLGSEDAARLRAAGVYGVDVAGAGGTSWSEVERHRAEGPLAGVAAAFRGWGVPTAECVMAVRAVLPDVFLVASGGIRSGLDAAVALALGADLVGVAGPMLRAAASGSGAVDTAVELIETLRRVLFCTGSRTIADLRQAPLQRAGIPRTEGGEVELATGSGTSVLDITDRIQALVGRSAIFEGSAVVASLDRTAAIVVDERERPLSSDFARFPSVMLRVSRGRLWLGERQRVLLVELDAGGLRRFRVQVAGI